MPCTGSKGAAGGFFLLSRCGSFPFHYPNAVALLFYRTLASYRLYIITMTGAAASWSAAWRQSSASSSALPALGAFGLALAAAPYLNEGMYGYYAVCPAHRCLGGGQLAVPVLPARVPSSRLGRGGAVLAFIACGTLRDRLCLRRAGAAAVVVYTRSVRAASGPRPRCWAAWRWR